MATEPDVAALWDAEIERRGAEVDADAQRGAAPSLFDEDRRELDNRLREDDEGPDGAIRWAEHVCNFAVSRKYPRAGEKIAHTKRWMRPRRGFR